MNVRITVPKSVEEYEQYMREATEKQFPYQTTELMMAAAYGDKLNVRKLAAAYAGKTNAAGNTALIYACSNGCTDCINALLKVEDIRHRNRLGLSGVDCAFRARRTDACMLLEYYCIERGYNEMKPKITTTKAYERTAIDQLKSEYELDAAAMFEPPVAKSSKPSVSGTKPARFCAECGSRFGEKDRFCSTCGARRQ